MRKPLELSALQPGPRAQLAQPTEKPAARIVGRGEAFAGREPPGVDVEKSEIGERAADIDAEYFCGVGAQCRLRP
jgi:hypothetical protein